jgi:CRP-like cAMP-binding protein
MSTTDDIQKMSDKLKEDHHHSNNIKQTMREADLTLPNDQDESSSTAPPLTTLLKTLKRSAFLQNSPAGACNDAELIDLLAKGRIRTFSPGEALVRQGEPIYNSSDTSHSGGGELYIVHSGQVSVHVRKGDKQASVTKLSGRNYHHGAHNHSFRTTSTNNKSIQQFKSSSIQQQQQQIQQQSTTTTIIDETMDSNDESSMIVGDCSLYTDSAPSSSIIADSVVQTYALPLSAVHSFIAKHPALAQSLSTRRWLWSVLARNQHFKLADDDTRKQQLIQSFQCETKRKGDVVVKFGDPGDKFWVVERGECEIRVPYQSQGGRRSGRTLNVALSTQQQQLQQQQSNESQSLISTTPASQQPQQLTEVRVATRGPSSTFGELSLIYSAPRSATVKCLSDTCTLWSVDGQLFASACAGGSTFLRHTFSKFASYKDEQTAMYFMTAEDFYRAIEYTRSRSDIRQQQRQQQLVNQQLNQQQQQQQQSQLKDDDDSKQQQQSTNNNDNSRNNKNNKNNNLNKFILINCTTTITIKYFKCNLCIICFTF